MTLPAIVAVLVAVSLAAFAFGYLFGRERKHHESSPLGRRF